MTIKNIFSNKKASHVGVVLSFVIFVTFLVFLFSIFGSPIKFSKTKEPLLDYLEVELNNRLISNLTILTITPDMSNSNKKCIKIVYEDLELEVLSNLNSLVKDKNSNLIGSTPNLYINWEDNNENFFKIFYSEETLIDFGSSRTIGCYSLVEGDISSFRKNYYFNENKINNFILDYASNYTELKQNLGLLINNEFSLSFTDAEGNINQTEQKDIITDIYSRKIPVQYFDEFAEINSGFINLKVW
ncbi:MAG: hypothetical protein ABFQ65_02495 [Nanoarchaeota archaeon]